MFQDAGIILKYFRTSALYEWYTCLYWDFHLMPQLEVDFEDNFFSLQDEASPHFHCNMADFLSKRIT